MMSDTLSENILRNFGGVSVNCLNDLLNNVDDLECSISIASESPYVETKDLADYLEPLKNTFSILDLNIQSLNAKFDMLVSLWKI